MVYWVRRVEQLSFSFLVNAEEHQWVMKKGDTKNRVDRKVR